MQDGSILIPVYPGCPQKWLLHECRGHWHYTCCFFLTVCHHWLANRKGIWLIENSCSNILLRFLGNLARSGKQWKNEPVKTRHWKPYDTCFEDMIHRRKAFLDADAGRLEDDEAAERQVTHQRATNDAWRLVYTVHERRHVQHHSVSQQTTDTCPMPARPIQNLPSRGGRRAQRSPTKSPTVRRQWVIQQTTDRPTDRLQLASGIIIWHYGTKHPGLPVYFPTRYRIRQVHRDHQYII